MSGATSTGGTTFRLLTQVTSVVELARDREIHEEFEFSVSAEPQFVGVIADDSDAVGRVHIGLVYEYWLTTRQVRSKEPKKHTDTGFVRLSELYLNLDDYEGWSKLVAANHLTRAPNYWEPKS